MRQRMLAAYLHIHSALPFRNRNLISNRIMFLLGKLNVFPRHSHI